jgi:hypothetical protein
MVAPVSHTRAQHDGFAMLAVIVLIVAACAAGYWWAQKNVDRPASAGFRVETSR